MYEGYSFVSILAMLMFLVRELLWMWHNISRVWVHFSWQLMMSIFFMCLLLAICISFFEKCLLKFFGCSYYFPNTCFFPLTILTKWITFRLMFLKIPPDLYLLKNRQCFTLAMLVNFFKTGLRPFTVRFHMISL